MQKMMCKNPNQDLVNIVYTKFGKIPPICSQDDSERKEKSDINQGP